MFERSPSCQTLVKALEMSEAAFDWGSLTFFFEDVGYLPAGILSLISVLYTNMESAIKSGGDVSPFPVKCGVKEECVLVPTVFTDCGILLGDAMNTDLHYADDILSTIYNLCGNVGDSCARPGQS